MNTLRLLAVALLAGFVIAGMLVPTGTVIGPAAAYFDVPVPRVAAQFTGLTGGLFLGYILSFFVFDHFRIKTVIVAGYLVACATVFSISTIDTPTLLLFHLLVIGTIVGLVSCASSAIISYLWTGNRRHTGLLAQDATFNLGGAVSAYAAGLLISSGGRWNSIYFVVAGIMGIVLLLTATSSFKGIGAGESAAGEEAAKVGTDTGESRHRTEWNASIYLIGFALMFFMFAKAVIIVWAPQFLEQEFALEPQRASRFMSNVYSAALLGSIISTVIVARFNVNYLILPLITLGIASSYWITIADNPVTILRLGYLFGIALSATVHAYLALGLTYVAAPTHKHIAFLLLAAGFGSTIAPYLSSQLVVLSDSVTSSIYLSCYSLVAVLMAVLISNRLGRQRRAALKR